MTVIDIDVTPTIIEITPDPSTTIELVTAPSFSFFWGPTAPPGHDAVNGIGDLWLDTA